MKKNILITGLFLSSLASFAQDAKEILQKSFMKCQSVTNGYYEMTRYNRLIGNKDTAESAINCSFEKLPADTLISYLYNFRNFYNGKYTGNVMYTGNEMVWYSSKDSSGTIMPKSMWPKEVKSYNNTNKFYTPFTDKKSMPMPHGSDFSDSIHVFKLLGEETLNGKLCYHIQLNVRPRNDSKSKVKCLREERHFWINKDDFIPLQYSIAFDLFMNNDTVYQYDRYVLNKYELNNLKDESVFKITSVPANYTLKDFVPFKHPVMLEKDSMAPNWELSSVTDEKMSLKALRGQLVLIDFSYKRCYGCMLALPEIEALNEKYKDKGLKVVGIDPYDKKEDEMADFIHKRGVTYPILLDGMNTSKRYGVPSFPTLFLIDKTGKIIFTYVGYNEQMKDALEEVIKNNL